MTSPTLLVLYNASGSLLGHLAYGYHHIRQTDGRSCSACTLTHGPTLALSERTEWTDLKGKVERGELTGMHGKGMNVKQLHTDELDETVKAYMKQEGLALPCALLREKSVRTVFDKGEMDGFGGDLGSFQAALGTKLEEMLDVPSQS